MKASFQIVRLHSNGIYYFLFSNAEILAADGAALMQEIESARYFPEKKKKL